MVNQYTRQTLDPAVVARRYRDGESVLALARALSVHTRRVVRCLSEAGVAPRTISQTLQGNQRNRKFHLSSEELHRLYIDEWQSIEAIEALTGIQNVAYHLRTYGIPIRGTMDARVARGAIITPQASEKISAALRGSNAPSWKGGITAADKLFYQSAAWKKLARSCKAAAGFGCIACHAILPARRLRAHHIIARTDSGPDTLDNLACYCNPCHRRIHMVPS